MDDEINAIQRNDTWELSDLPRGYKTIGAKWVFKTKLKEVDKYKAWLVVKAYKQQYEIDYTGVFSLVAQYSWTIFQLDVKSAFLHGNMK